MTGRLFFRTSHIEDILEENQGTSPVCQCSGSGSERKKEEAVIKSGEEKENWGLFLVSF